MRGKSFAIVIQLGLIFDNVSRLTFEYESLQKVENEQKMTIEKLSNNES